MRQARWETGHGSPATSPLITIAQGRQVGRTAGLELLRFRIDTAETLAIADRATPPLRESLLRSADAGSLALSRGETLAVLDLLTDWLVEEGLNADDEPNALGLRIETLIDLMSRPVFDEPQAWVCDPGTGHMAALHESDESVAGGASKSMHSEARELAELWKETVRSIECGYELALEDYENDLSSRERLERLISFADESTRSEVFLLDERLMAATAPTRRPVWLTDEWWTEEDASMGAGEADSARIVELMSRTPRLLRSPFIEDFRDLAKEPDLIGRGR